MKHPAGLYIHVPFCRSKCGYCDFYSLSSDADTRAAYVKMICRMLETTPLDRVPFSTVYFGGGTPSLLTPSQLNAVLEAAARCHGLTGEETTLECNPGTVDAAFFQEVHAAGINRVSFGLQSSDQGELRALGRTHSASQVRRAVQDARHAGIYNISLDVMLGLPGQNSGLLHETLRFCRELAVPHVSAYLLKIEQGTPFAKGNVASRCPDEDAQAALYLQAVEELEDMGLYQYEISNFARPGFHARHNTLYWQLSPYLGLGPSAYSFWEGRRFHFPRDLERMLALSEPWEALCDDGEGGDLMEYVMLRLRLAEGLCLDSARRRGLDTDSLIRRAAPLIQAGLVRREACRISLTPQGFLLSNSVILRLLGDNV